MILEGKKIIFLGDSITEGHSVICKDNIYHQRIKRAYGLSEAHNCGVSGTRIAKRVEPRPGNHNQELYFALRATCMPTEADAIVIFGGTNDFGHGDAKLGKLDDTDVYTFAGAYNTLIAVLREKYPEARLIAMTPLKRSDMDKPSAAEGLPLSMYVDMVKAVAKKHGIDVIDLFSMDDIDPFDKTQVVDGLHPGDHGHEILAEMVARELVKL